MPHFLTIELPDAIYEPFSEAACRAGRTPAEFLAAQARIAAAMPSPEPPAFVDCVPPAEGDDLAALMRFAGCVGLSSDSGDNESIDDHLAAAYDPDGREETCSSTPPA